MPRSQQPAGGEKIIYNSIIAMGPNTKVLDVGAGDGKWSILTGKVNKCIGLEIWGPYIQRYNLYSKYDGVICIDIREFHDYKDYDVMIFGDILEHIPYTDAVKVVEEIKLSGVTMYLSIPISLCVQIGCNGNPHEEHLYQWKHEELESFGFRQLHVGTNPNGLVKIGTYVLNEP